MKIERLNNWLTKIFIVALVLTQAIIFVTTRAAYNDINNLPIQFLLSSNTFTVGDQVLIQANIDASYDFTVVYFILRDSNQTLELQFQAIQESGGQWVADSLWNTANFEPGEYYLSATASAYDGQGNIIEFASSNDHIIILFESTVTPPEDEGGDDNATTTPPNNPPAADEDPVIDPPTVENIISPVSQEQVDGNDHPIGIALNRALIGTEILGASLYNINGQLMSNYTLVSSSDNPFVYQGSFGDTSQYLDGDYYMVFWLDSATNYLTDPIVFTINNQVTDEPNTPPENAPEDETNTVTDPVDYLVELIEPINGGIIESNEFITQLQTNFDAEALGFILSKDDDPSIGEDYIIVRTDGFVWNHLVILDDIFINGSYILTVIATDQDGNITQEVFTLYINLPVEEDQSDDGDGENPLDENATTTPPNVPPEDDASDDQDAADQGDELDIVNSCQTTNDCINLCSGCFHVAEVPVIDCAGLPVGDCICQENICISVAEEIGQPEQYTESSDQLNKICLDSGLIDEEDCTHWLAMLSEDIDQLCLDEQIYDVMACEDYLNRIFVDIECQNQQIIDPQACRDYLLEKYAADVACLLEENICHQILEESYLNRLVIRQHARQAMTQVVDLLIGHTVSMTDLADQLSSADSAGILPIQVQTETSVLVVDSPGSIVLIDEQKLETISSAVLVLDSDADGLPDDLENYYGTDLASADTDNDGYLDGEEVNNNYNPLGEGRLDRERTDLDRVILSGAGLEQPKSTISKVDDNFEVVEAISEPEESKMTLSGRAQANSWIVIYLYSDLPLVLTTKSDSLGNWSYTLQETLTDGQHKAYVTINDNTGKIVKQSNPLSFFVRSAQAVSISDYFEADPQQDRVDNMVLYYLLGGAFLIVIALGILIFIHRSKGDDMEEI